MSEFSTHVENKEGGSWSLLLHVFLSPSSEEEGGDRATTSRFSPDCWEPEAMSIFSLSQLLQWRGPKKKSSCVLANGLFYKHGRMQNDTSRSKKNTHTLTEGTWKVSWTRAGDVLADRRLLSVSAADKEVLRSRGLITPLGTAESQPLLEECPALIPQFTQCW